VSTSTRYHHALHDALADYRTAKRAHRGTDLRCGLAVITASRRVQGCVRAIDRAGLTLSATDRANAMATIGRGARPRPVKRSAIDLAEHANQLVSNNR
jgi:hypothetical protein